MGAEEWGTFLLIELLIWTNLHMNTDVEIEFDHLLCQQANNSLG